MSSSTTRESDPGQRAHDRPVLLHSLVFLDEGAEVTVGRADVDGYVVLPAEGRPAPPAGRGTYPRPRRPTGMRAGTGRRVDIDGFLDDLDELGFLRDPGESPHAALPVRWQRLARRSSPRPGPGCWRWR